MAYERLVTLRDTCRTTSGFRPNRSVPDSESSLIRGVDRAMGYDMRIDSMSVSASPQLTKSSLRQFWSVGHSFSEKDIDPKPVNCKSTCNFSQFSFILLNSIIRKLLYKFISTSEQQKNHYQDGPRDWEDKNVAPRIFHNPSATLRVSWTHASETWYVGATAYTRMPLDSSKFRHELNPFLPEVLRQDLEMSYE